jgi:DNA-directed RNA polymerase subunit A'
MSFQAKFCKHCPSCKKTKCDEAAYVSIKEGMLVSGTIDEKAIGAFSGKLLDRILSDYGSDMAADFLNNVTRLALYFLKKYQITTGLDEEDLPPSTLTQIDKILKEAENKVKKVVEQYQQNTLKPLPGRDATTTLEEKVMGILNKARDATGDLASRHLSEKNQVVAMIKSGGRGNILNITQMSACLGQQAIRGRRILRGYYQRTLPHFKQKDLGCKAHGFIASSYKKGLDPIEFFFHAMGARESLTDTAMRTPKSGYLQRRLINAGQDLIVAYNGVVKNGKNTIVQFTYGEDGLDPAKTDYGKLNIGPVISK